MNNGWLKFLVPRVRVKVETLADVSRLRAERVKIYGVERIEGGYLVTVRHDSTHGLPVVGQQSIYGFLLRFAAPTALIWASLLIALPFITVDYEVRGNLPPEEVVMVTEHIAPYFFHIGPFSFFRSNAESLTQSLQTVFHDYIWIDIESHGSRLVIDIFDTQVVERAAEAEQIETIYARSSGEIVHIDVTGCLVLVELEQIVRQGEPLISCYTPTGFGTDVAPIDGVAAGAVYAHVWYEIEIEFPREYAFSMVTSNSRSAWFLNVGETRLNVWGEEAPFDEFEVRQRVFNPLGAFNFSPISLERVHYYEKSDIILNNEIEQIRAASDVLVQGEFARLIEGEFEVVDLVFLELDESEDTVRLVYHATILEDIARVE
ncbi:MAG: sporulation protein YqfD [Turicibacter sp.]|nr:sporulation protein YqfD [Turicibacter sp.]